MLPNQPAVPGRLLDFNEVEGLSPCGQWRWSLTRGLSVQQSVLLVTFSALSQFPICHEVWRDPKRVPCLSQGRRWLIGRMERAVREDWPSHRKVQSPGCNEATLAFTPKLPLLSRRLLSKYKIFINIAI